VKSLTVRGHRPPRLESANLRPGRNLEDGRTPWAGRLVVTRLAFVNLKGGNGNLDQTVEALLDRLSKRFVSSNALATSAEQRALYVATDQDSLRVAPAGATEVVLPSR
jgi:hypothetical protein